MRRITAMPPKTMLKTLMAGTMLVGAMLVGTGMTPAVAGDDIALAMTPIPPDNSLYRPVQQRWTKPAWNEHCRNLALACSCASGVVTGATCCMSGPGAACVAIVLTAICQTNYDRCLENGQNLPMK
jgi:hypothetical protein